jgi:hypothetical protein
MGKEKWANLVLRCGSPVGDSSWVCDALFQAVGAEGSEHYARWQEMLKSRIECVRKA